MFRAIILLITISMPLSGNAHPADLGHPFLLTAIKYLGMTETNDRSELQKLMNVDPIKTEWCAAFANSIIRLNGYKGSEAVSPNPLLAKSFSKFGVPVLTPEPGDIVVFDRIDGADWQGHVGFYVRTEGEKYQIISGNSSDMVKFRFYPIEYVVAIRRPMILD